LRFLSAVVGGWIVLRVASLMPEAVSLETRDSGSTRAIPAATARFADAVTAASGEPFVASLSVERRSVASLSVIRRSAARRREKAETAAYPATIPAEPFAKALPSAPVDDRPDAMTDPVILAPPQPPVSPTRSRWNASLWGVARNGTASAADAGQLGGSQAGMRVRYAIDEARRLGVTARVAAPLRGAGADAAIGVDWRPLGSGVAVIVERRFALDDAPGGTAAFVAGGFGPMPLGQGFAAEGYAQAGGVARERVEPFADGAMRVAREVASVQSVAVTAGMGAWGGAQRETARLDIGPTLGAAVPVGGQRVRIAIDWRRRVAGNAAPGSGPALTIGTDF
jgi:hypothetical protein